MPGIEAAQWLRLKGPLADLAELAVTERDQALRLMPLEVDDRRVLEALVNQLAGSESRLPVPSPAAERDSLLRWQIGDVVGSYVIDGLLGRGGMGEVYAAHARTGEPVALKVLRQGLEQGHFAHFANNEQRALQRLDDPRIARFIEAFALPEGDLCLVLEQVDGESLMTWCERQRLDANARLDLFVQICQAVASAHQQLVVHRDLKPGNVLVTSASQIKLLDFGIAKLLDEETTPTQTHGGLYTLEYAAPEQVLRNPVSAATDVYALGALLFHLLAGASPYVVGANESLVKAVLSDRPRSLSSAAREAGRTQRLDRDLDRVIARAMEKDPRDRYRSAIELAADVQAVRSGAPISAGGSRWYRFSKFVRRHPAGVAMATLLLATLLVATGVSLHWARRAEAHTRIAEEAARRAEASNRFMQTVLDLNDSYSMHNKGDLTLAQVIDRAVELAATELSDEPEVRADVLGNLSTTLQKRGNVDRARLAATEAVRILAELPQREPGHCAASLLRLAFIEFELNELDSAESRLREALRLVEGMAVVPIDMQIIALSGLARISNLRGETPGALEFDQKIVALRTGMQGDQRAELAMDYFNLGSTLLKLSRLEDAIVALEKAIGLLQESVGDAHPRMGIVRSARAAVLIALGRIDAAQIDIARSAELLPKGRHAANNSLLLATSQWHARQFEAALATLDTLEPDLPATMQANVQYLRGRIRLEQGDNASAATYFAQAEQSHASSSGEAHPRRWLAQGLRLVAEATPDASRLDAPALEQTLSEFARTSVPNSIEYAELLLVAGTTLRRHGDADRALYLHRACDAIQRRTGWLGEYGQRRIESEIALDQASIRNAANAPDQSAGS